MKITKNNTDINVIDKFLKDDECKKLIEMINNNHTKSTVSSDDGSKYDNNSRTSSTSHFREEEYAKLITNKISAYLGIKPSHAEPLQGQYYQPGEYFKAHTDYFHHDTPGIYAKHCEKKGGNRTITFMIYLNEDFKGGETYFTKNKLSIVPKAGRCVYWNSLHKDGTPNEYTEHEGSTIQSGRKYIVTQWYRINDYVP